MGQSVSPKRSKKRPTMGGYSEKLAGGITRLPDLEVPALIGGFAKISARPLSPPRNTRSDPLDFRPQRFSFGHRCLLCGYPSMRMNNRFSSPAEILSRVWSGCLRALLNIGRARRI